MGRTRKQLTWKEKKFVSALRTIAAYDSCMFPERFGATGTCVQYHATDISQWCPVCVAADVLKKHGP